MGAHYKKNLKSTSLLLENIKLFRFMKMLFLKNVNFQEYSGKQVASLVNCACQNNKRVRQMLLGLIEELGY